MNDRIVYLSFGCMQFTCEHGVANDCFCCCGCCFWIESNDHKWDANQIENCWSVSNGQNVCCRLPFVVLWCLYVDLYYSKLEFHQPKPTNRESKYGCYKRNCNSYAQMRKINNQRKILFTISNKNMCMNVSVSDERNDADDHWKW